MISKIYLLRKVMKNLEIIDIIKKYDLLLNCTEEKKESIYDIIKAMNVEDIVVSKTAISKFVSTLTRFPGVGRNKILYWTSRGHSLDVAKIYVSEYNKKCEKRVSPFSIEFWTDKGYDIETATFMRNSRRPINFEYWVERGYSIEEAKIKAIENKSSNNKKGALASKSRTNIQFKNSSVRCVEYYLLRGFSEEDAKAKVSNIQSTFSLEKCIEKHGLEEGTRIWSERQEKWQETLNSKDEDEMMLIISKKIKLYDYLMTTGKNEFEIIELTKKWYNNIEEFKLYSSKISTYTDIVYNDNIDVLDPLKLRSSEYHLDHKVSRVVGFVFDIPIEVISCVHNLNIITSSENHIKCGGCSITIEELLALYNKDNPCMN